MAGLAGQKFTEQLHVGCIDISVGPDGFDLMAAMARGPVVESADPLIEGLLYFYRIAIVELAACPVAIAVFRSLEDVQ